jgi:DNA-binding transcriptional ArsR family regulator
MNDFSKQLEEAGPLGTGEGLDKSGLKVKLQAVTNLIPYIKLVERERLRVRFDTEEEYKTFFTSDEVDRLFRELFVDKLAMSQILLLLRERPLSAGEISEILGADPSEVSTHLNNSARQGLIEFDERQNRFIPVQDKSCGGDAELRHG